MTTFNKSSPLPPINPVYRDSILKGAAATSLAALALWTPWESIRIIGMTVLFGAGGNIINHWFSCHNCEYYGGANLKDRPIRTENSLLNALTWGVVDVDSKEVWKISTIAGGFFAICSRCPLPSLKTVRFTSKQLAPYLAIGTALSLIVSHLASRGMNKTSLVCKSRSQWMYRCLNQGAAWFALGIIATRTTKSALEMFSKRITAMIAAQRKTDSI